MYVCTVLYVCIHNYCLTSFAVRLSLLVRSALKSPSPTILYATSSESSTECWRVTNSYTATTTTTKNSTQWTVRSNNKKHHIVARMLNMFMQAWISRTLDFWVIGEEKGMSTFEELHCTNKWITTNEYSRFLTTSPAHNLSIQTNILHVFFFWLQIIIIITENFSPLTLRNNFFLLPPLWQWPLNLVLGNISPLVWALNNVQNARECTQGMYTEVSSGVCRHLKDGESGGWD